MKSRNKIKKQHRKIKFLIERNKIILKNTIYV